MSRRSEAPHPRKRQGDRRALLLRIGFLIGCAALLLGLLYLAFGQAVPELIPLLRSGDETQIAAYLGSQNRLSGILSTAVLAFLQPISILLPGAPIQIAAGIVYGTLKGFLICHVSYVLSNVVVFYLARVMRGRMERYVSRFSSKLDFLQRSQYPAYMTAMACLIPLLPNGIIPYAAARTRMKLHEFVIAVVLGSFFPILVMCAIGKRILRGDYISAAVLFGVSLLAVLVLSLLRGPICRVLHRLGQRIVSVLRRADLPPEEPGSPKGDDLP